MSEKNLVRFRTWLVERGRSQGTADLYVMNLRKCHADPKGITHRLIGGSLSPNTSRTNLASLRAWALFSKDTELSERLRDLRLPPARRVKSRAPLSSEQLKVVVKHLRTCDVKPEPLRHVLLIMALRGLRAGDVLRIRRTEVVRALETGRLPYEGKGRKRLEFSATPIRDQLEALAMIKGWDRVSDLIGKGTSPRCHGRKVWRAAVRTGQGAGIKEMNPHRFRHTFATRFLDQLSGDPNAIVKLQRYMGWESMGTAARYVDHISHDELDRIGAGLAADLLDR